MNDLTGAREHLATLLRTALGSGLRVDTYVPEELDERHVVMQLPANPLVAATVLGGAPESYELTIDVYLLLSGLTNEETHDAADDYLARVLPALHASAEWRLVEGSVSSITSIQTAQGTSAGVSLSATAVLTITQE